MSEMEETTSQHMTALPVKKHHFYLYLISGIFVTATILGIIATDALRTSVVSVAGSEYHRDTTDAQIVAKTKQQLAAMQVTLTTNDGEQYVEKLSSLGVSVDEATFTKELAAARKHTVLSSIVPTKITIPTTVATKIAQVKLDSLFSRNLKKFANASLRYDRAANTFQITSASAGHEVLASGALRPLQRISSGSPSKLVVQYTSSQPAISEDDARAAQTQANKLLALRLDFTYKGKLYYYADPWDIAKWVKTTADTANKQLVVTYDKAAITKFMNDALSTSLRRNPTPEKQIISANGTFLQTVQAGVDGFGTIKNAQQLADQVYSALAKGTNASMALDLTTTPYSVEKITVDGQKWAEVNLTTQRAMLHVGDKTVASFLISSGISIYATRTGTFSVWYKTPTQTMTGGSKATGDYYSLPDVRWDTYFDGGNAFHTAYWHNNFGTPMSHGCINMREADAKVVYDFAPLGTKVVVHY